MPQPLRSIGFVLSLLCASVVLAHHDAANHVTEGKPINWQGTVAFVSWDGAHVMYRLNVAGKNGDVATWEVQGGSPRSIALTTAIQRPMWP